MTDNTNEHTPVAVPLPRYGRAAFVAGLLGAAVLLLAGMGIIFTNEFGGTGVRVLAWLAIAGTIAMVGGIISYIVAAAMTIWRAERGANGRK
jgi:hypothetical protein